MQNHAHARTDPTLPATLTKKETRMWETKSKEEAALVQFAPSFVRGYIFHEWNNVSLSKSVML